MVQVSKAISFKYYLICHNDYWTDKSFASAEIKWNYTYESESVVTA